MRSTVRKLSGFGRLPTLRLEGGLFLPDMLEKAALGNARLQQESDYGLPRGLKLKDEFSRAFQIACAQWKHLSPRMERADIDAQDASFNFITELLRDAFGYSLILPSTGIEVDERRYPITHLAHGVQALGATANMDSPAVSLPIVMAPYTLGLDEADPRFALQHQDGSAAGHRKKSAFQLMQEYLNAPRTHEVSHAWGFVCNGRTLRLVRAASTLTRPSYLEVDLQDLLSGQRFAEFAYAWRLLHASRAGLVSRVASGAIKPQAFAPEASDTASPVVWEAWRVAGLEEGTRVRQGLRIGVTAALFTLGNGFIQQPANEALRHSLQSGALSKEAYFAQLLRLIYRLIFVFSVEERGLMHNKPDHGDSPAEALAKRLAAQAYQQGYALGRLRDMALRRRARTRYADLWQSVQIVFRGLAAGEPRVGLPALGGLFERSQCPALDHAQLSNADLLSVMESLRWARHEGGTVAPIDYLNMGVEELGSVYESLLELVPEIDLPARRFGFVGLGPDGETPSKVSGSERKLTGSYYTPDSLVQELIKSALDPVIEQRLAAGSAEPVEALLAIRVIDPACGSGHFLLAAARRLAERLAQLRSADGAVNPQAYRHALREVIARCIFGVDRNPMAIELARTALWLEGFEEGRPLSFLDHHLQCGDALLGLTDLKVLHKGIPKNAFVPLSGDDKETCKLLTQTNAKGLKQLERDLQGQQVSFEFDETSGLQILNAIEAMPSERTEDITRKETAYLQFLEQAKVSHLAHAADLMLGAYLLAKTGKKAQAIPTSASLYLELTTTTRTNVHEEQLAASQEICCYARVLHWPLAFPQVFAAGGFDCVLGNPPWEVSQMGEEEFFATRAPEIAKLIGAKRKTAIADLPLTNPSLWDAFAVESQKIGAVNNFYRESGRFQLTAVGKLNTYSLFAETMSGIVSVSGRAGFIVPTGIATDDSTKAFFGSISQSGKLVSLFDIENREAVFPAVHRSFKFCLLTLGDSSEAEFVCYASQTNQLADPRRRFKLTPDEFRLLNPNTLTFPVFRSNRDAELTKKIYRAAPVLIFENKNDGNPWGIQFSQGLFNMTSDSSLFFESPSSDRLPLYEAKLIHQFDHRWATYTADGNSRDMTLAEKQDPNSAVVPRYWVDKSEVKARLLAKGWKRGWLMGWRDICRATDERTVIASVLDCVGVGHTAPLIFTTQEPSFAAALLANFNTLALDYCARVKIGGTHLTYGYLKQFPILSPNDYSEKDIDYIKQRILELTYCSTGLTHWANELGYTGNPFPFNRLRRAVLRAELDAYFARLYGLNRDELRYILDPADVMGENYPSETFRVLKNGEMKEFGEYRTQRLVLEAWDRQANLSRP
jgi:N-6 DNA Methylase